MVTPTRPASRRALLLLLLLLLLLHRGALCSQHKIGGLDGWGPPPSADPTLYADWSHRLTLLPGDSLLFLYPPSQDSVIQVSEGAFAACDLTHPIMRLHDGNSLFNITRAGELFFTSGRPGNCLGSQKLHLSVLPGNGSSGSSPTPSSPSYPTAFGSIPAVPSAAARMPLPVLSVAAATAFFTFSALLAG